jgi:hypothetical protein
MKLILVSKPLKVDMKGKFSKVIFLEQFIQEQEKHANPK